MKLIKFSFILAVAALLCLGISTASYAFHSGGVAECEGCHTMHNSFESESMPTGRTAGPPNNNIYLLQGSDQSSTCLNCHNQPDTAPSSYHISTQMAAMTWSAPTGTVGAPVEMTPGGDFAWLKVTFTWAARETTTDTNKTADGYAIEESEGQRHGHSIVAGDFNYSADSVNTVAPGGTYPAGALTCISCHDPHNKYRRTGDDQASIFAPSGTTTAPIWTSGSYGATANSTLAAGVYRILGGKSYVPKSQSGVVPAFGSSTNPPMAVAPSTYNQAENVNPVRVAYGQGMSAWCGNCHGSFADAGYTSGSSSHPHPAGKTVGATVATNYNAYVKSGDLGGQSSTAYNTLVPFEDGASSTYSALAAKASNKGSAASKVGMDATGTSVVMCLSCHRAHATAFDSMTRWFNGGEFLTGLGSYVALSTSTSSSSGWNVKSEGRTPDIQQQAYYNRPATVFANYQRSLCNKCHAKD